MTTRKSIFDGYLTHPWLHRVYSKLSAAELYMAKDFLVRNAHLSKGDFEIAINRMFLDKKDKTKNWVRILELLSCANSAYEEDK